MVDLTEQNISEITLLVEARGVEMEELSYDLVDHICCMIEEKMESGLNYASALEESMSSFGKKGIRHIQEETTFLLTKNILAMRKTMHITGITSAVLLLFATIFKIQHWPGAGVMYVLGVASLCLIFMPIFLTVRVKEKIGKPRLWINIVGTISAFILCFGILFKIMHWPTANILMTSGGIMIIFIYLPLYIFNYYKNKELRTNTVITTVVAIAGASMLFSLVNLRGNSHIVRTSILNMQYTINNDIAASNKTNTSLLALIEKDSIADKAFQQVNEIALSINKISHDLNFDIAKSYHTELSDDEIKTILKENYTLISDDKGDLISLRKEENGLVELMILVDDYQVAYKKITGTDANLKLNQDNLDYYLKSENTQFPLGIVVHDLSYLNLQIQRLHSGLLQYYKGKVS
ncbi:MAG: hypothetical protein COA97_09120 [Flavobacteriales bacterium]|nr:MAG: hypothetical protein COA97_09120 [Flavobacteriales bacterium]